MKQKHILPFRNSTLRLREINCTEKWQEKPPRRTSKKLIFFYLMYPQKIIAEEPSEVSKTLPGPRDWRWPWQAVLGTRDSGYQHTCSLL